MNKIMTHKNGKQKLFLILTLCISFHVSFSQKVVTSLPKEIKETSALVKIKSGWVTVNDSGNEPKIFIFNKKGEITHTCFVENAKNIDWETLAYDREETLYIGDFGNNQNTRKYLAIYKVNMKDVLTEDTISATKINFSYPEQVEFPPEKKQLYYDAEALVYKDNQLLIITKNRTVPFDGIAKIYQLPTLEGTSQAQLIDTLQLPATNWREESITAATTCNNQLFILTYSKIYVLKKENHQWEIQHTILFDAWTQKEGIAVDKKYIYVSDENASELFTNNSLYRYKKP